VSRQGPLPPPPVVCHWQGLRILPKRSLICVIVSTARLQPLTTSHVQHFPRLLIRSLKNVPPTLIKLLCVLTPRPCCTSLERSFRRTKIQGKLCTKTRRLVLVRHHVASVIQQESESQHIGATWWYVLQTHWKMDEFLDIGFKPHPSITPVFSAHLDRFHVSHTSFNVLQTSVKRLKTDLSTLHTVVNRLNGARGNAQNPCAADTDADTPTAR
jgi:hypothetical protein